MKGGVQSMLHILVKNGFVVDVIQLSDQPGKKPDTHLLEELDYKVEYLDHYEEEE
jgi:hypothetical protein